VINRNYGIQVAVVGFVSGDALDLFNAAGDSFDDVPFGILDADAAAALDVAEGKIALLKQVNYTGSNQNCPEAESNSPI